MFCFVFLVRIGQRRCHFLFLLLLLWVRSCASGIREGLNRDAPSATFSDVCSVVFHFASYHRSPISVYLHPAAATAEAAASLFPKDINCECKYKDAQKSYSGSCPPLPSHHYFFIFHFHSSSSLQLLFTPTSTSPFPPLCA
ncbi:hypothetical protein GQ42DRAFT_34225 [Ramicandelaber brevisporus]|nr:hypothetical protein GQ42DRAFT_34225 [Ramicandelaber brevisporus]